MRPSAPRRHASLALWVVLPVLGLLSSGPVAKAADVATCTDTNAVPAATTRDEAQAAVLCLVNRERDKRGLRPLRGSKSLTAAAAAHSRDMVARRYFDHASPGGRNVVDRVMAAHWTSRHSAWRVGENIAWGSGNYATPRSIVTMWMHSPGHRANILDTHYREAGAGVAVGAPQHTPRRAATYTMDFGARG